MKSALYASGALLAGALLASFLLTDPGSATFTLRGTTVEMSLPIFVLACAVAYLAVRIAIKLVRARQLYVDGQRSRRRTRARRSLAQGLLELSQGDWRAAESTVTRLARESEFPMVHYLVAARAADLQGQRQRCDDWLAKALDHATEERAPVLITQAEILLRHKRPQAALTVLEQLETSGETNARALVLLARIYRQTGDWERLQALEPRLRGSGGVADSVSDELVVQIYLDRLQAAGASKDYARVSAAWDAAPASVTRRADATVAYARAAMGCGEHTAAEQALRELLNRQWEEAAVLAYGELEPEDDLPVLETAEKWLRKYPEDPALLLACARLCIRAELYGKAHSYLEASSLIRPRPETLQLLANLQDQLGERDRAFKVLNEALALAIGRKQSLPRVRAQRALERRRLDRRRS